MNVRRMEGEVVRDSVLFLAGRLDERMGGPDAPVASAEAGSRRTIYYRYASGESVPLVTMFDAANVTECYRRHETIVPQQALALSNSGMVLTASSEVASAIDREVGAGLRRCEVPSWSRPSSACLVAGRRTPSEHYARRAWHGWPRRSLASPRTPSRRRHVLAPRWFTCCSITMILSRSDESNDCNG